MESYEMLIIGRFLVGVNCGLNTSLVPMYISEIAPLTLRGGLGTINQLAVTVGLLISQILSVESLLGSDNGWPYLLGLAIIPPVLQLILLPICPESPRYLLITRQREFDAREALKKLRNSSDIEEDIAEMKAEEQAQKAEAKITMIQLLRSQTLRKSLIIACLMQLSQQLSGINAVTQIHRLFTIVLFKIVLFTGLLLFYKLIYNYRTQWDSRKICNYWNRNCNGDNDFNINSFNG